MAISTRRMPNNEEEEHHIFIDEYILQFISVFKSESVENMQYNIQLPVLF
jgi:hypothetical protein